MKNTKNFIQISIFILIFFFLWTLRQYSYLFFEINLSPYIKTFVTILLKFVFWVILALLYSKYVYKENAFRNIKLKNNKIGILYALLFAIALLSFNLIFNYLSKGVLFNFNISIRRFISAVIFAPFIEEFVFRGFILNKLKLSLPFFWANMLTATLFVCAHIPGWVIWGNGISVESSISILLVSFVWGYLYKKTDSFLSPVLAHSLNNLISMVV
jgi:membrane protease YdiL (CAAX protease family)